MAQLLLGVLALGAAYALIALGFVLILNATGAVNFSQGDLVMAGGFGAVALGDALHLSGLALLPALLVGMAVLGAVLAALTYMPLRRRPPEAVFISTIAFGIILQNLANRLFGAEPLAAPSLLGAGRVRFAGIDASRLSNVFFVTPSAGSEYMVKAYIAVVIGGWGSIPGAVAGALLIAAFEVLYPSLPLLITSLLPWSDTVFSQTTSTVVLDVVVLLILVLRPQGLFGERVRQRP